MLVITKKECSKYGIECNELIEEKYQKEDEIIKHQKVEDIKMPKSSKNDKGVGINNGRIKVNCKKNRR